MRQEAIELLLLPPCHTAICDLGCYRWGTSRFDRKGAGGNRLAGWLLGVKDLFILITVQHKGI